MSSQSPPPDVSSAIDDDVESEWEEIVWIPKVAGTLKQITIRQTQSTPHVHKEEYLKGMCKAFSANFPLFLEHIKKSGYIPELQLFLYEKLKDSSEQLKCQNNSTPQANEQLKYQDNSTQQASEQLKYQNNSTQQASEQLESQNNSNEPLDPNKQNDSDYKIVVDPREVLLRCLQSIYWIVESHFPARHNSELEFGCRLCMESADALLSFLVDFKSHSDGYDFVRQEIAAHILCRLFERGALCPKVQEAALARLSKTLNSIEKHPAVYCGIIVAVSSVTQKQVYGESQMDDAESLFPWYETLPVHLLDKLSKNTPSEQNVSRVWDALQNLGQDLEDSSTGKKLTSQYFPVGHSTFPCEFSLIGRPSQVLNPTYYSLSRFLIGGLHKGGERSQVLPEFQKCTLVTKKKPCNEEEPDEEEEDDDDQVTLGSFKLTPFLDESRNATVDVMDGSHQPLPNRSRCLR